MVKRAENLKALTTLKNIFHLALNLLLVSQVKACLETDIVYGSTVDGSTNFSDFDHINTNFKDGMVIESITAC